MRPGDIPDDLVDKVSTEFKKRRNLTVDLDITNMLVDILNEWLSLESSSEKKR